MSKRPRALRHAMMRAFAETQRCAAEKARLLPPLLVDLVPSDEWIACVARSNRAEATFIAQAKAYCASLDAAQTQIIHLETKDPADDRHDQEPCRFSQIPRGAEGENTSYEKHDL